VVDDNADALEMLVEALIMLGYEAHAAPDVSTALRLAQEKRPDVALLDIGLPEMDGYQLGQRLRQLPGLEGLRLVALTGYSQASDRARSRELGFAAHLVKPIDLDALGMLLDGLASSAR
jgi:CheY-like chemotaxis protein